jgi:hypothetical protein
LAETKSYLEGSSYFTNPNYMKIRLTPWAAPYNADGSYNINDFENDKLFQCLFTSENNVVWQKQMRTLVNAKIEYKIIKDLTFSSRINLDYLVNDYML